MDTQVVIIGGGPSGLLLSQVLNRAGIATVVLERSSRAHVLSRIRAGVLEWGSVELLREAGIGARMDAQGLPHDGTYLTDGDRMVHIDFKALTGRQVMIYGQTEVTRDLMAAAPERGLQIIYDAANVALHDVESDRPSLTFEKDGAVRRIEADFLCGCDGFHGPSRQAVPPSVASAYEKIYPFGWLGILADVPPCTHELIYANHARGFALASMRSETRSRYYVQVALDEKIEDWPDDRLWDELAVRLGPEAAANLTRGPSLEKSIAPLRSFVFEPMRHGRLLLAGDSAHIVPPTGAKGLNLAASDVHYLSEALIGHYLRNDRDGIAGYSRKALARVWKSERFSWQLTKLMHRFPDGDAFDRRMQVAELDYIASSTAAQSSIAENYVGLPL